MNILLSAFGEKITIIQVITRVGIAVLIGGIIGFERERKNRPAGLRTHMLVCMAAGLIAMVEQQMVYEVSSFANSAINVSVGRLTVGVISGIGFIGAGTIMMAKNRIVGLTTAASLWCTACLGLVSGMGYGIIALISAVIVVLVLEVMRIGEKTSLSRVIEVEYIDDGNTAKAIEECLLKDSIKVNDSSVSYQKENEVKHCTSRYAIIFKDNDELKAVMSHLADVKNVISVKIQNVI